MSNIRTAISFVSAKCLATLLFSLSEFLYSLIPRSLVEKIKPDEVPSNYKVDSCDISHFHKRFFGPDC